MVSNTFSEIGSTHQDIGWKDQRSWSCEMWQCIAVEKLGKSVSPYLFDRPFFLHVWTFFLAARLPEFLNRHISLRKQANSIASYLDLPKFFELPTLLLAVALICGAEIVYSKLCDLRTRRRLSIVAAALASSIVVISPFDAIYYVLLSALQVFAFSEGVFSSAMSWYPTRRKDIVTLVGLSLLLALGLGFLFLNTRIVYFSFHLAEYTLIPRFWELGQSILDYWPRHGLYEVWLGQWMHALTQSWDGTGYISEYLIKCGTVLDFAFFGWFVSRATGSRKAVILSLASFPFVYHLLGFAHVLPIIGMILLLSSGPPKVVVPVAAFVSLFWFILRTDYGLFSLASVFLVAVLFYRDSVSRFALYAVAAMTAFAGACYGLLGTSPASYLRFIFLDLASHNKALLGSPAIDFSSYIGRQVLLQLVMAATAVFYCYRSLRGRQAALGLVYSTGLLLCNFQLLTSRSDGHVFTVAALFNGVLLLPHIHKSRQITFLLLAAIVHCASYFVLPRSGQSQESLPAALNPKSAFSMWKRLRDGALPGPYTPEAALKIQRIVAPHRDKVTFAHLLPYEYVLFNTRPPGRIADTLHASPDPLRTEYLDQVNRSEIVFLEESNLDGFPDKERFQWFYRNLNQKFEYWDKVGPLLVYKKRLL